MALRLLLVEDDHLDSEWIINGLKAELGADIELVTCERDFVKRLEAIVASPPDLVVFDVMLRWAPPSEEVEREGIPADVLEGGFFTAGLRCVQRLQNCEETKELPYVFYTGLNTNTLGRVVLTKSEDIRPLVAAIRSKLEHRE